MGDFRSSRLRMVERDLAARGIRDRRVLDAFREVPREDFVDEAVAEFAYEDAPLPIGEGQTISQPYVVAVTLAALELPDGARVLEVGTGSGYAAALLSRIARDVVTIERVGALAARARERLARLGYHNVRVLEGDGSLGWAKDAPYDAIAVAAGGPRVPRALMEQLAVGGTLVMPVGPTEDEQTLLKVTREGPAEWREQPLGAVSFVPLIGQEAWNAPAPPDQGWTDVVTVARPVGAIPALLREAGERIDDVDDADVGALLERIGDARVVLLGESTHGSSELYRLRARVTRELIARRGFRFVAVEADWPDAARIDDYVAGHPARARHTPFSRFPQWMWRNEEVARFVEWLRAYNAEAAPRAARPVGFHGLDLYSMFTSISAVLDYLDEVDPDAARVARHRYGALTPWQKDPAAYGRAVLQGRYQSSEGAVLAMLREMLERRVEHARRDGDRLFDATQNARVVASAEKYYRAMYYASADSWNLRDGHMFETLRALFDYYGEGARGVVWAHNTHVGDARATEFVARGEQDLGQLCRDAWGPAGVYIVGFATDHGTVMAAHEWDEPGEEMGVRPSHARSYERLLHDSGVPAMLLHVRDPVRAAVRDELLAERIERAIGVVYSPETELASHYFQACLPRQFDEIAWIDATRAVVPIASGAPTRARGDAPETYPFGV